MSKKGICTACGMLRWIGGAGGRCKPCGYFMGHCAKCTQEKKLYVDSLCYCCYQDRQVRAKLLESEPKWLPTTEYSQYLFKLYLIYIRRYLLKYSHLVQAKQLSIILIENTPPAILSWMQIFEFSERDQSKFPRTAQRGCAWIKVGFMLQELGVIPPREDERGKELKAIVSGFTLMERDWIDPLIKDLQRSKRSEATLLSQIHAIRVLNDWLRIEFPATTLLQVNPQQIREFSDYLKDKNSTITFFRRHLSMLHRFYRSCQSRKLILANPCENIPISRESPRLQICSPEQTQKLFEFVKTPNVSAEDALLICLVLFYGLTISDLAHAKLAVPRLPLQIILRRTPRTKGRRFYHRSQTFTLSDHPHWFLNLQQRFLDNWKQQYERVKKTYPLQTLFFPKNGLSNRPLCCDTMKKRFNMATQQATGSWVTSRIVRQTCGHIHSQKSDASILTRLGWSPQFAFHYTWLPRTYTSTKSQSSNSSSS